MKLQEADAKALLLAQGLPVPDWEVAHSLEEARLAADGFFARRAQPLGDLGLDLAEIGHHAQRGIVWQVCIEQFAHHLDLFGVDHARHAFAEQLHMIKLLADRLARGRSGPDFGAGFLARIAFEVMDAGHPNVEGPFDLIAMSMTLHWLADPLAALDRLSRLLAPGGVLIYATISGESFVEWREVLAAEGQPSGLSERQATRPGAAQQVGLALGSGDQHRTSMKLRKWDAGALGRRGLGLSLTEKASLLKHVAKWHYA